jgi:Phage integrase family
MNWALDRGMIEVNPIAGLKPPHKERSRELVLPDEALASLMRAAEVEGYPFGDAIELLILTGQRRSEVAEMRWSEVDFERAVWTIPSTRSKNGQSHEVPLSPSTVSLLRSLPRFLGSDWVFTTIFLTLVSHTQNGLEKAVRIATIRPLKNGHAFSIAELKELRNILRVKEEQADTASLQFETDAFAAYVGLRVYSERKLPSKKRVNEIKGRFLTPIKGLLQAINDPEFSKEFLVPWGCFDVDSIAHLKSRLEDESAKATAHIQKIQSRASKGEQWDASLKRPHVYLAACLCEYLNHEFEPKRMNADGREEVRMFHEAVTLLAKPLFEQEGERNIGFSGAIREHMDNWNQAKRLFWQEIEASRSSALGQS